VVANVTTLGGNVSVLVEKERQCPDRIYALVIPLLVDAFKLSYWQNPTDD
jgi:hypothetical protein